MTTHFDVFDKARHDAQLWLDSVMDQLDCADPRTAFRALRAVLHTLRERVGHDNAVHLGAQLPMLIRGVFYEGWHPSAVAQSKERSKSAFLDHVRQEAHRALGVDAEQAVEAVFRVLYERIDQNEIAKLINLFPQDLRGLWPAAAQTY